jgi:ferredoxin
MGALVSSAALSVTFLVGTVLYLLNLNRDGIFRLFARAFSHTDKRLAVPTPDTAIYACGPARMLEALESCCASWPEDALRMEHFSSTIGRLDPTKEHAFEVELKDSGIVVTVAADQTLLAALRAANIDVQSDCHEGLCGSCEVRVLSGKVDHRDVVLTRAEATGSWRVVRARLARNSYWSYETGYPLLTLESNSPANALFAGRICRR